MRYKQTIEERRLPNPEIRRALRMTASWTLDEVASILGVTKSAVWKWEAGQRNPRAANRNEYAKLLHAFREVIHDE